MLPNNKKIIYEKDVMMNYNRPIKKKKVSLEWKKLGRLALFGKCNLYLCKKKVVLGERAEIKKKSVYKGGSCFG